MFREIQSCEWKKSTPAFCTAWDRKSEHKTLRRRLVFRRVEDTSLPHFGRCVVSDSVVAQSSAERFRLISDVVRNEWSDETSYFCKISSLVEPSRADYIGKKNSNRSTVHIRWKTQRIRSNSCRNLQRNIRKNLILSITWNKNGGLATNTTPPKSVQTTTMRSTPQGSFRKKKESAITITGELNMMVVASPRGNSLKL